MLEEYLIAQLTKHFPNKTEKQVKDMIIEYNDKIETYYKHSVWYSLAEKDMPTVRLGKNQKVIEQLKHQYYSKEYK
jgi:hypothetical protein